MLTPRPNLIKFHPPVEDCRSPFEVEMTSSEDIDIWFRAYVLDELHAAAHYYNVTLANPNDLDAAIAAVTAKGITLLVNDYVVTTNADQSEYCTYLKTVDGWISFYSKSPYDTEGFDSKVAKIIDIDSIFE